MGLLPPALQHSLHTLDGYLKLLVYALNHAHSLRLRPVRSVFDRQVYFTALEAFKTTAILALLCGALVATQITALTGGELVVNALAWTIVGELGPLLTAIVIISRSSAAIASELALMRLNGEILSIDFLGISHHDYLLLPRIYAVAVSVAALNIYFQAIAIAGGLLVSSLFQHVSFSEQYSKFFDILRMADFLLSLLKGLLYGIVIAVCACYHGMNVRDSITEVPKATTHAVSQGILAIFILDAAFAYASWLIKT